MIVQDAIERAQKEVPGIQGAYRITGDRPPIERDPGSPLLAALSKTVEQTTGAPAQVSYFTGYTDTAVIAGTRSNHNCMSYAPDRSRWRTSLTSGCRAMISSASRRCLQTCCYRYRASHRQNRNASNAVHLAHRRTIPRNDLIKIIGKSTTSKLSVVSRLSTKPISIR